MRYLLLLILTVAACSSGVETGDVPDAGASFAPLTTFTDNITNGTRVFTLPVNTFCRPTLFGGTDASSQAPVFKWGVIGYGGISGVETAGFSNGQALFNIFAIPNNGHQTPQAGLMSTIVKCDPGAAIGTKKILAWGGTGTVTPVSGSVDLDTIDSACWLTGVGSMSNIGEHAWLDVVLRSDGYHWRLNASGFASLSAEAQCANLGHYPGYNWMHATPGTPAYGPLNHPTCFIHNVTGIVDNGTVRLHTGTFFGNNALEVSGGVTDAEGYCD